MEKIYLLAVDTHDDTIFRDWQLWWKFKVQRVFYWVSLLRKRECFPCAFALWLKLFLFLVEKEAYEEVEAKEEEDEGKVSDT